MRVTLIHLSFASLALQGISPIPIRHFVEFEIDRNGVRQKQEGERQGGGGGGGGGGVGGRRAGGLITMDEYQHMERFSMENEYQDGMWIDGEFFARKRKSSRRQTKEEALYGFEESDSDDDDSSANKRRRDVMKKGDLTKPVNFVSTGKVMPSEEIDRNEEEASEVRVGVGLGFGAPGLGLGAGVGLGVGVESGAHGKAGEEDEEEEELLPSAFGKRIKEGAEKKEREREKGKQAASKAKSLASGGPGSGPVFEMHTKGIGMKLLEKMGYKGGGLGKNQQGIAMPIEAKLRPKNMGMGFNEFRETTAGLPPPPGMEEPEAKSKELKPKPKEKLWLKRNKGKKKQELLTAADVLAQSEAQGVETVQTVLDMRGPQVRVLTNLENLNAEQAAIEDNTPMPELQHNLRLIVDLAEAEIKTVDRKLRHERDTVIIVNKEKERLQKELTSQKHQLDTMEDVLSSIEQIQHRVSEGGMTLETLADAFKSLKMKYWEEYKLYDLGVIALSYSLPLMLGLFRGWEPLQQRQHGVGTIAAWRDLLQGNDPQDFSMFGDSDMTYTSSPFSQLVTEVLFPAIRSATTNFWEPRDPEPMLQFLETWEKLLPAAILQNILENLVMPKLVVAVDAWDPRQETVPIHAWLHPWLPLLGGRMEPLYHPIRFKLGNALQAWHPSDSSALALLSPWHSVFDPSSWEHLLVRSILPKLMYAMQELTVNPAHQQLDQFNWVMAWVSAVPIHHMVNLLEIGFFPKWQQVLYNWLCANPNYEEVSRWYLGWKSLLPPELLANERIRHQLNIALEMMNQALEGAPIVQAGTRENLSFLQATEHRSFQTPRYSAAHGQQQQQAAEMSLKEVVEAYAQDNDVQFLPKPGRTHEGLQVYGFGAVNVIVDAAKQVILAQNGNHWVSTGLEQLLKMHRSQAGSNW